jgi:hypothetical protein
VYYEVALHLSITCPDLAAISLLQAAETAILFAHATGRTLVMPPVMKFYLLDKNPEDQENQSTFHKFFDFSKVSEGMTMLSMEDFINNVAKKGLLKKPFPPGVLPTQKTKIYNYMEQACHMKDWEPGKHFIGFNITSSAEERFGTFKMDKVSSLVLCVRVCWLVR